MISFKKSRTSSENRFRALYTAPALSYDKSINASNLSTHVSSCVACFFEVQERFSHVLSILHYFIFSETDMVFATLRHSLLEDSVCL